MHNTFLVCIRIGVGILSRHVSVLFMYTRLESLVSLTIIILTSSDLVLSLRSSLHLSLSRYQINLDSLFYLLNIDSDFHRSCFLIQFFCEVRVIFYMESHEYVSF